MPPQTSIPLYQWYSVYLATVEVTLGGILHAARIPLTGYILSLHQVFCLARASRQDGGLFTSISISTTVAILKTLSPSGKRLTPMIAIMAQGFLFNVGTLFLGNNLAGHMLGATLLSLWGFIQPALFATLIFGQDLWTGLGTLQKLIDQYFPGLSLIVLIGGIIVLKISLALGSVLLAKSSVSIETWVQSKISTNQSVLGQQSPKNKPLWSSLLKDLTSFWLLFSLMTVIVFSLYREDPLSLIFLTLTRYLATSILLFMALRLVNVQKLTSYLEQRGLCRLSSTLRATFLALSNVKRN